jgi:hypothetical protein
MHSSRELRSSLFEIRVAGETVPLDGLFDGFTEHDRLGVVVNTPCGAVGASALITAAVTAFYDVQRARGSDFFIYPDYYLFHVGRPLGDHARLDVWPRHKEVVVPADATGLLETIVDRGITRLAVPEGEAGEPDLPAEDVASLRARVATCLAYSPSGRVRDGDVRIASNPVSEGYVEGVLDPEARIAALRAGNGANGPRAERIETRAGEVDPETRGRILAARRELVEDGVPVETYRRIGLDDAVALLESAARPG